MKATDLRIGNLVYSPSDKKEIKIDGCDIFMLQQNNHWCEINFEPIELTEEWLLKMGFELTYNSEFTKTYEPFNFSSIDAKWNKTYGHHIRYKGEILENIKHVHQLQNLYHTLTGEELTIK